MPTPASALDHKGHGTMPRRSARGSRLRCVLAVLLGLATLPVQTAFSQERLAPVTPSPEVGIERNDDTEGGRCRVISKRRLFGGTFLHRKCDDHPALASAPSQDVPQASPRTMPDREAVLQGGPTIHGDSTADETQASRDQAEVAPDDDTEGGRCRVISKRRLFGGTFLYRKCDDRAPGASA